MDSPRGAQRQAVQAAQCEPTGCASAQHSGDLCDARLTRAPQGNSESPGVAFSLVTFFGEAKESYCHARHERRWRLPNQPREEHVWLVSVCGGSLPALPGLRPRTRFASPGYGLPAAKPTLRPALQRPLINRQVHDGGEHAQRDGQHPHRVVVAGDVVQFCRRARRRGSCRSGARRTRCRRACRGEARTPYTCAMIALVGGTVESHKIRSQLRRRTPSTRKRQREEDDDHHRAHEVDEVLN